MDAWIDDHCYHCGRTWDDIKQNGSTLGCLCDTSAPYPEYHGPNRPPLPEGWPYDSGDAPSWKVLAYQREKRRGEVYRWLAATGVVVSLLAIGVTESWIAVVALVFCVLAYSVAPKPRV